MRQPRRDDIPPPHCGFCKDKGEETLVYIDGEPVRYLTCISDLIKEGDCCCFGRARHLDKGEERSSRSDTVSP